MNHGPQHEGSDQQQAIPWLSTPDQPASLTDSVLRLVWSKHQISRTSIAKRLGLSRSTVTEIVKDLLQTPFVAEEGRGASSGGRRPVMLEFQDDARCFLGIDIGATHVGVVVMNLRGRLLDWKETPHPVRSDPKGTWSCVDTLCKEALAAAGQSREQLLCIGLSLPGPVDPSHPDLLSERVLPDWHGRTGIEYLQRLYDVPTYVDNDANLGALAEHAWGAARGTDNVIFIKLGRGIGAGFVLKNELYRGAGSAAGELGHVSIDRHGHLCGCGLRGCLGTYVGLDALKVRMRTLIAEYPDSHLAGKPLTYTTLKEAGHAGDTVAQRIIQETAANLGLALTGFVNMLNPGIIVLGGGLSQVGDLLLKPLRETLGSCVLVSKAATVEITTSTLGPRVIPLGAATLALKTTFTAPNVLNAVSHTESS